MAEGFLEEIYADAKMFCEFKRVAEYAKVHDEHQVVLVYDSLMTEFSDFCKRYMEYDKEKAIQLYSIAKRITEVKGDVIVIGDMIEHDLLPVLEACMERWGKIEQENEDGDFCFESTASGFLTIKDLKRNRYYHSVVDPMWEARKLAEYIYEPQKQSYTILGCGLGYLIYQLYIVSEGSVVINVFEKDERIVEYARNYGVLEWIPKDRLNVVVSTDILDFLQSAGQENMGVYIFPPELKSESENIRSILEEVYVEFSTNKKFERIIATNFWRNIKSDSKWVSEFDVSCLKKEMIVVAAGPSLDENMDFLKENKGKKTIIAVGTVFKKLLKADIIPDIVVVVDPQARTYEQIRGIEEQRVPMLLAIAAYWKFAATYKGEKYLVPVAQTKESISYIQEHKQELWNCEGTVTSLGIETAIRFGAKKVYLLGVDLAYPNGISHATGTLDRTQKTLEHLIPVEGVGNQIVYTSRLFMMYRDGIEEKIAQTPHIAYYNMSRYGIKIAGAKERDDINN